MEQDFALRMVAKILFEALANKKIVANSLTFGNA
jgi:hypothetical protein